MKYTEPDEVWKTLGKDAFTKVRGEIVGTGNGSTSVFDLDHDNVIYNSLTVYSQGTTITSGFSTDLDDGKITFTVAPSSGSVITSDYNYSDMPDSIVQDMIESAELSLEKETGRIFSETTGSTEYYDYYGNGQVFLRNYPINTVSSIKTNQGTDITASWKTLTSGSEWYAHSDDLDDGIIYIIDEFPTQGKNRIEINYGYGYSTIPYDVKELATLISVNKLVNSTLYKSIYTGKDGYSPIKLEEIRIRIEELLRNLGKQSIGMPN